MPLGVNMRIFSIRVTLLNVVEDVLCILSKEIWVVRPDGKKRNNRHFPSKTSSFASDCKRLPLICALQWHDVMAWNVCEKIRDMQEINQINTCQPTASWSELLVRLIHKNGQNWPFVCWFDRFGGSAQYLSVNGCFSWLPHLAEVVLKAQRGAATVLPSLCFLCGRMIIVALRCNVRYFGFMITTSYSFHFFGNDDPTLSSLKQAND